MAPQIIFGTASFGMDKTDFQDETSVSSLLRFLREAGVGRLDSASRYPPLYPGRAEELVGESDADASWLIDTKVYTDTKTDGGGDLTAQAIEKSVSGSLSRLQREREGVNILHIHRADPSTPIPEQVRAFNEQIKKGHCQAWGVSNVPVPMLKEMFRVCEEENLPKPTCYQGDYNIMTRGAEAELLPLLREHGMVYNAFRALAAGFLTGNYVKGNHAGTRFADDNPLGKLHQGLFSSEELRRAMDIFSETTARHGLSTLEVAARWIFHHSHLGSHDGVILGASKQKQVEEVIAMLRKGSLPSEVVEAANDFWNAVKDNRGKIL